MSQENGLNQYVHDVISNPIVAKSVPTATFGLGLNEIVNWVESSIAFAAMVIGFMTTVALWRKIQLERRETELRIEVLERQLQSNDTRSGES